MPLAQELSSIHVDQYLDMLILLPHQRPYPLFHQVIHLDLRRDHALRLQPPIPNRRNHSYKVRPLIPQDAHIPRLLENQQVGIKRYRLFPNRHIDDRAPAPDALARSLETSRHARAVKHDIRPVATFTQLTRLGYHVCGNGIDDVVGAKVAGECLALGRYFRHEYIGGGEGEKHLEDGEADGAAAEDEDGDFGGVEGREGRGGDGVPGYGKRFYEGLKVVR